MQDYLDAHADVLHDAIAAAVLSATRARADRPLLHVAASLMAAAGEPDVLEELKRLREENEQLSARLAAIERDGLSTHGLAKGPVSGMDAMNSLPFGVRALR